MGSYEKYKEEKGDVFMSKKMRFWMMGVMGVMMAGLVCVNVYALDDKDVVGTWYANSLTIDSLNVFHPGAIMMEMSMEFKEGGKGEVTTEFEWKIDGDNIVITSDDEVMEGVYSDGNISIDMDGMTVALGQEKEEYVPYEPGKALGDVKLEDFDGEWNSTLMSAFGMQVPTGTLFDMKLDITISGGKATLVTTEGGTETTIELEGELDQNALILNATTEKEVEEDSEDYSLFSTDTMRFYLLEDGKLCFTTGDSLEAEATDAEAEEDDDSMDFTIKVYFDKLVAE